MIKNNIVIIISRLDIAGMNMLEKLKLNYTFKTKEINFIGIIYNTFMSNKWYIRTYIKVIK